MKQPALRSAELADDTTLPRMHVLSQRLNIRRQARKASVYAQFEEQTVARSWLDDSCWAVSVYSDLGGHLCQPVHARQKGIESITETHIECIGGNSTRPTPEAQVRPDHLERGGNQYFVDPAIGLQSKRIATDVRRMDLTCVWLSRCALSRKCQGLGDWRDGELRRGCHANLRIPIIKVSFLSRRAVADAAGYERRLRIENRINWCEMPRETEDIMVGVRDQTTPPPGLFACLLSLTGFLQTAITQNELDRPKTGRRSFPRWCEARKRRLGLGLVGAVSAGIKFCGRPTLRSGECGDERTRLFGATHMGREAEVEWLHANNARRSQGRVSSSKPTSLLHQGPLVIIPTGDQCFGEAKVGRRVTGMVRLYGDRDQVIGNKKYETGLKSVMDIGMSDGIRWLLSFGAQDAYPASGRE
ncbi:hypothetical protein M408DRAFT_326936 [Serendipita vermifera MAFF 305830]|uniref:Uncharacterized protein n=1 Tax=Serendipita vermifera MAFF 305830 TaxID=933852 RepID=A0A0C3B674_SERVB|nr:hypothetical protein M408DRAFT_326936 [Serendipita vermifera MAFF 305830]